MKTWVKISACHVAKWHCCIFFRSVSRLQTRCGYVWCQRGRTIAHWHPDAGRDSNGYLRRYSISSPSVAAHPISRQQPHTAAEWLQCLHDPTENMCGVGLRQTMYALQFFEFFCQPGDAVATNWIVLLRRNCHMCLYGSETSQFFTLDPPPLDLYLT